MTDREYADALREIVHTEVEAVVAKRGKAVEQFYTIAEAAERLRVSVRTIHKLKATGQLRFFRVGVGRGRVLIPEREMDAYVAAAYRRSA